MFMLKHCHMARILAQSSRSCAGRLVGVSTSNVRQARSPSGESFRPQRALLHGAFLNLFFSFIFFYIGLYVTFHGCRHLTNCKPAWGLVHKVNQVGPFDLPNYFVIVSCGFRYSTY